MNFILNITYAHVRTGYPLTYKTSTQCSTGWILWRWWHKSISYNYCCTVRFSHKTLRCTTDRFISCMAWWLLFSKWKWLIRKAFPLVCTLSRLRRERNTRGWPCCLRDGRGGRRGGRGRHTQYNSLQIYWNFWLFCFFISLNVFLYSTDPSTVSFSFRAHIIEWFML